MRKAGVAPADLLLDVIGGERHRADQRDNQSAMARPKPPQMHIFNSGLQIIFQQVTNIARKGRIVFDIQKHAPRLLHQLD